MKPAMIAFVVAIAGTMFPAISFTLQRDCRSIPKISPRRLDADVTKSSAIGSSLSKVAAPTSSPRSA